METMISSLWTIVWTIANIIILYLLLKKFLFKPLNKVLDERQAIIQASLDDAEKSKTEAMELKESYESAVKGAKDEARQIIQKADIRAKARLESADAKAREDAEILMEKAKIDIEKERDEVLGRAQNEIADLALEVASKVIRRNMETSDNERIVKELLEGEGA